jgi:hypothetical protein
MSEDRSDGSGIWGIIIISIIGGIVFFFNKSWWPELHPILRCLIAPVAGVVIIIGYYLLFVVLPNASLVILWEIIRWFTKPSTVVGFSFLGLSAIGVSLLFKWISIPIDPYWASLAGIAIGSICGFIIVQIIKSFQSDSWLLQSAIGIPISSGLAYWFASTLTKNLEPIWIIVTIILVVILMIRFVYEGQNSHEDAASHTAHYDSSDLPQDVKQQILANIREQIGDDQYERLVSSIGEDGIINLMLENAKKRKA